MAWRKLSFRLIFLTLALSYPFTYSAQVYSFKVRVTEEVANIRVKPDIRSPIITQVRQNTVLFGLKREGEWILVTWADEDGLWKQGYIHESLVAVIEPETALADKIAETKKEREGQENIALEVKKEAPVKEKKDPEMKMAELKDQPTEVRPLRLTNQRKSKLKINLAPGSDLVSLNPINESALGLACLVADLLDGPMPSAIASLHWLPTVDLSFQFPLQNNLASAFQISGSRGEKENLIFYGKDNSLFIRSRLQTLWINLLLNYDIWPFLSLAFGPEIYPIAFSYLYRLNLANIQEEWSGQAWAWGYGFRGTMSINVWWSKNLAIKGEIGGRKSWVGSFKGRDSHLMPSGEKVEEEGKLYFFQVRTSPENLYSLLFIRAKKPTEAGVETAHEAKLDLSGLILRLGLSFRF